jgi:hypothetical protein
MQYIVRDPCSSTTVELNDHGAASISSNPYRYRTHRHRSVPRLEQHLAHIVKLSLPPAPSARSSTMPPLYPHQAVILKNAHYKPTAPGLIYSPSFENFLELLILAYCLWALCYLLYITLQFCTWVNRTKTSVVNAAFGRLMTPRYELRLPSTRTWNNGRVGDSFLAKSQVERRWMLCGKSTDLWSVLSNDERECMQRDGGVKNSMDRRRRNRTTGLSYGAMSLLVRPQPTLDPTLTLDLNTSSTAHHPHANSKQFISRPSLLSPTQRP